MREYGYISGILKDNNPERSPPWSNNNLPHSLLLYAPSTLFVPITASSHLQQRQVWVQVSEAVQDHRAAVLDHLQLHTVPNVPHPPRRLKHFDQLDRDDAMRLA